MHPLANKPTKQNNLLDHPERSPHNRRLRQQAKHIRSEDRPGIARDTPLMPWLIADSVCTEAFRFLDSQIPLRYIDALDSKAERCYARNLTFRKLIRSRGNKGRDALYSFMRHWLYAFLTRDHRRLALRLPPEFAIGHPIQN